MAESKEDQPEEGTEACPLLIVDNSPLAIPSSVLGEACPGCIVVKQASPYILRQELDRYKPKALLLCVASPIVEKRFPNNTVMKFPDPVMDFISMQPAQQQLHAVSIVSCLPEFMGAPERLEQKALEENPEILPAVWGSTAIVWCGESWQRKLIPTPHMHSEDGLSVDDKVLLFELARRYVMAAAHTHDGPGVDTAASGTTTMQVSEERLSAM